MIAGDAAWKLTLGWWRITQTNLLQSTLSTSYIIVSMTVKETFQNYAGAAQSDLWCLICSHPNEERSSPLKLLPFSRRTCSLITASLIQSFLGEMMQISFFPPSFSSTLPLFDILYDLFCWFCCNYLTSSSVNILWADKLQTYCWNSDAPSVQKNK